MKFYIGRLIGAKSRQSKLHQIHLERSDFHSNVLNNAQNLKIDRVRIRAIKKVMSK